jgi:hypothetical protein
MPTECIDVLFYGYQNSHYSLHGISWFVFIENSVYCALQTDFLKLFPANFRLKRGKYVNTLTFFSISHVRRVRKEAGK